MLFTVAGTQDVVSFSPHTVIIAGFTGRDKAAVEAHIRELAGEGIHAPASVPAFYTVSPTLLSDAPIIQASEQSSGEAEPVLLCADGRWLVTVGSDHTARDLERTDIAQSKRACPKPIATDVWLYDDIAAHWDQLVLRSWAQSAQQTVLYQEAPVANLLRVPDVLAALQRETTEHAEGAAIFLGTVPLLTGRFVFAPVYSVELSDPVTGRSLRCTYQVRPAGSDGVANQ